ncbi:MAG: DsbE family thiol:disulfide interchange protein [Proteobacteria bacterium]|jgi:cytochrome c biogenesis protein CcmG/thiol:disulfide interchange protein DsbE|nr:DsbE family thiol:disulfide interchange protein [Pseudomonadota bacterium]
MRLVYVIPLVVFATVAAAFGVGLTLKPNVVPSALIDKPVPEFTLAGLPGDGVESGKGFSSADLTGRVSIVNVFASWCFPCRVEHPLLMRLARNPKVRIFGLNYKDRPEDARAWLKELGNPYDRIGVDRDGRIAIDWGVYGVPETFIIDAEGRIRYKHVGPITPSDLDEIIVPIIERLSE